MFAFVARASKTGNRHEGSLLGLPNLRKLKDSLLPGTASSILSSRHHCDGSYNPLLQESRAMMPEMRLLCRPGLIPTALCRGRRYAPRVCQKLHTTTVSTRPAPPPRWALYQPPTRPKIFLYNGGRRNASFEAGENDSGHISAGPNEGIFFFDSKLSQDSS